MKTLLPLLFFVVTLVGSAQGASSHTVTVDIEAWIKRLEKRIEALEDVKISTMSFSTVPGFLILDSGPYTCPICKRTFEERVPSTCAVHHGPGNCCHYNEKEINIKVEERE